MSYSVNGRIQSGDYNGFIDLNTPNVNTLWGIGSGNKGYGQPELPQVTIGNKVRAEDWINLINTVNLSAAHQGTSTTTLSPMPVVGGKVLSFAPTLENNINLIDVNSGNALAQGADTTTTTTNNVSIWNSTLTITFTVTFASINAVRYFFNSGGQIGLSFSHPAGSGVNEIISDICSEFGTMWLSSPTSGTVVLSGTSFNGITKIGGVSSIRGLANANNGFYALTNTPSLCYIQYGDVPYYGYYGPYYPYVADTFLRITASYNGSGVLTLICLFDELPSGSTVATGTVANLIIRPPSATYITNTWGTPSVGSTILPV